jgi:hypothetical protein
MVIALVSASGHGTITRPWIFATLIAVLLLIVPFAFKKHRLDYAAAVATLASLGAMLSWNNHRTVWDQYSVNFASVSPLSISDRLLGFQSGPNGISLEFRHSVLDFPSAVEQAMDPDDEAGPTAPKASQPQVPSSAWAYSWARFDGKIASNKPESYRPTAATTFRFHSGGIVVYLSRSAKNQAAIQQLMVPHWLATLVPLSLPAIWCLRRTRWARRALWKREGRCLNCGYSLNGLPAGTRCPECGQQDSNAMRKNALKA